MERTSIESLFARWRGGDEAARDPLFRALYDELHQRAAALMQQQRPWHSLQATDLVNAACAKLIEGRAEANDKPHFVRLAAVAMRQVLVDHARKKASLKNDAPGARVTLDGLGERFEERSGGLLELDAALERLGHTEPELLEVVTLRFFGGRSMREIAEILGLKQRTAERRWQAARLFLREELSRD